MTGRVWRELLTFLAVAALLALSVLLAFLGVTP